MAEKKEPEKKDLVKKDEDTAILPSEDVIQLGKTGEFLDLRGLTEVQKQEIKTKYAEAMIEVAHKAAEVGVDTRALDAKLGTMAAHTKEVADQPDASVTITATQDDSIGRTEIIMGTSDEAKKGKLTRSQTGQRDLTPVWIGLAVFVIIVITIIVLVR
ncbi:MAG TPA: hypothetical protein VMW09_03545 [Desulfatiglandales bacterium]|nr:hypothetical protein [Desulfatiglandales bacterium]